MNRKHPKTNIVAYKSIGSSKVESIYSANHTPSNFRVGIVAEKTSINIEEMSRNTKVILDGKIELNLISTDSQMIGPEGNYIGLVTKLDYKSINLKELKKINNDLDKIMSKTNNATYSITKRPVVTIRLLNPVKHKRREFIG